MLFIAGCYLEPSFNKIEFQQMAPWSPWPMRGHFFDHTGRSPFEGPSKGIIQWTVKTDLEITSSPAIGKDGTIYIGSWDKNLYAVSPHGETKWIFSTNDIISGSPAVDFENNVYFGSWDGKIYSINSNDL